MEEKCYNCKYESLSTHEQPCCDCFDHSYWIAKDKPRDSKQIWSELLMMYITELDLAMGNDYNECDTVMRDIKKDTFIEKLSELCEAIREEC